MRGLRDLVRGLKTCEIVDLSLLALAAVMLPYVWNLSFWCLILLSINAIVKVCNARRVGNTSLTTLGHWSLWMGVGYVAICAISLFYTDNMQRGVLDTLGKCTFLFPLFAFLISDFSYLKKNHLKAILYLFTAALILRFLLRFVIMLHAIHNGANLSSCLDAAFDPETHHSYVSMYVLIALVFLILEMIELPVKYKLLYGFASLLLVGYLLCIQSRAGLLCLVIIALIALVMYVFIRKKYIFGLIAFFAAIIVLWSISRVMPDSQTRLLSTIEAVMKGQRTDDRFAITKGAVYAIKENMPWGTGIGDRMDELIKAYQIVKVEKPYEHKYNPHNQFMDTLLSEGILGLAVLMAMIFLPFIEAVGKHNWLLLFFLIIVTISACFESVFERQMGEIYFSLFLVLFLLPQVNFSEFSIAE